MRPWGRHRLEGGRAWLVLELLCCCALFTSCASPRQGDDGVFDVVAPDVQPVDAVAQPQVDAAIDTATLDLMELPDFADSATEVASAVDATPDAAAETADIAAPPADVAWADVAPAAPQLTFEALSAALQSGDSALTTALLAQYDMPLCSASQCLFVVVAPSAKAVAVTGDWANWATDTALTYAAGPAVWWAAIPMQVAKKLEYKVKLDGQWALDPANPHFAWNTYGPNSAIYGKNHSRLRRIAAVQSPQLGNSRDVYVYLPAAYFQQPDAHFGVLYLQDGFNVFSNPKAPFGSWDVESSADELMGTGEVEPLLMVGIDTADRNHEYVFAPLTIGTEVYAPKLPLYTAFVVDTLKPLIDKMFRTLPDRSHTGMGGSSLGGLSSMWIGWTAWQTFGLVASFSGAYWMGESGAVWNGTKTGQGPSMRTVIADASKAPPVGSLRIYMDSGDTGFDGVANYDGDAWVYSDWTRNALLQAGWDSRPVWQPLKNLLPTTPMASVPAIAWTAAPAQGWKALLQPEKNLLDLVAHGHQHNEAAWKQRFGAMLRFLWPGPSLK